MYISPYWRPILVPPIFMKFGIRGQLADVITCVKFLVDRFRGYGVLTPQNCHFPLTWCVALTTVYVLPWDTVIIFKADADAAMVVAGNFFQVVACVSVSWLHWMQSNDKKWKETREFIYAHSTKLFRVLEKCWDSIWSLVEDIWSICGN